MRDRRAISRAERWLPMAVAIAALSGIAAFFVVAVLETQQAHRSAEVARLQDTARALGSAVDAQLGAYVTALTALAATELPLERGTLRESLREHLGDTARALGGVIAVTEPGPDFRLTVVSAPERIEVAPQIRPSALASELHPLIDYVFRERRPIVSHIFWGPLTRELRIGIYVPVIRGGEVRYVLSLSVQPSAFQHLLDRQGLVGGVRASVVDDRDRMVALVNFPSLYAVGTAVAAPVAAAMRGQDRALVVGTVRDGSRRALALERLTMAPGWYVAISRLDGELDAIAWHELRWVQIAGGAFVVLVVLVIWISRRQVRRDAEAEAEALRAGRAEIERLHAGLPAVIFLREVAADGSSRRIYRSGDIEAVTGWPAKDAEAFESLTARTSVTEQGETRCFRQVLRDGSGEAEYLLDRPGGQPQWMRATMRVIERRPGGGGLVVGYIINVDQEVRAREAANAAQQELDRTLANAPVAVYRGLIMADGRVQPVYRSPGFLGVTGWTADAIAARGIFAALAPDDLELRRRSVAALRETGEWRADTELRRPDGSRFWGRVHSRVLDLRPDGTIETIGFIQDVTQELQAEQTARRVQRLASLGEFSSGVAHELRQPLATMMIAAENALFALESDDGADVEARLNRIVAQVERATGLIEHLRQFARGSRDEEEVEALSLDAIVAEAIDLVGRSLQPHQIAVDVQSCDPAPLVLANRIALEQVIVNLVSNARDALGDMPACHARRITLLSGADAATGTATLTVADTGGGIPAEVMRRLFEPFVTSKGPDKGTGIGLSLCFGLMRSMGGMIEGANGPDGGAVFTLTLRLAPPPSQPAGQPAESISLDA